MDTREGDSSFTNSTSNEMELKRYHAFVKAYAAEVENDPFLSGIADSFEFYRHEAPHWYDKQDFIIADALLIENLSLTIKRANSWRPRNSKIAYVLMPAIKAVLVINCFASSRTSTLKKIRETLYRTLKHSNDEFDAKHDPLTGLLNNREFDKVLHASVAVGDGVASNNEVKSAQYVAIIAFDLDHFKQINDSYGHDYGDIVLRCFSRRIERIAQNIAQESDIVKIEIARTGGEEFMAILNGFLTSTSVHEIAEKMRLTVVSEVLPTEHEWEIFLTKRPGSLSIPHVAERRVSVSVGVSSIVTLPISQTNVIQDLRREADAALYRAKAGGRNTVRLFPDIRDRYGMIIEHHTDAAVVVLDIGSSVGARVGDEFSVFHPDFKGDVPFYFSDGRTKRQIGRYPKLSSGRAVVFDVQPDISFGRVVENTIQKFPTGSSLEYIPAGSIAHLISSDATSNIPGVVNLMSATQFEKHVKSSTGQGPISVVVFELEDAEKLARASGAVFVNRALAGLFESIQDVMSRSVRIGQLQTNRLAFAVQSKLADTSKITLIIQMASSKVSDAAQFGAGLFRSDGRTAVDGDSSLERIHALEYASYAALRIARGVDKIEEFTTITASRIISEQRLSGKYTESQADYAKFCELGVKSGSVENQMALLHLQSKNMEKAIEHISLAISLSTDIVFNLNFGFILVVAGRELEAHQLFSKLKASSGFKPNPAFFGAEAVAAYAQFLADPTQIPRSSLIEMLEKAIAHKSVVKGYHNINDAKLSSALADVLGGK